MPELPEVENVCRELSKVVKVGSQLIGVKLWRKNLRYDIPEKKILKIVSGAEKLLSIQRRAKFIKIGFAQNTIISHLGMTGVWKVYRGELAAYVRDKHDHLGLWFSMGKDKVWLIYNDPRRFGFVDVVSLGDDLSEYFSGYGFEPLEMSKTEIDVVWGRLKDSKAPIKSFIMDQKHIVGVGNIYACEALYAAKINPFKPSCEIKKSSFLRLIEEIKKNLTLAISLGGSSIKNYRSIDDKKGDFQSRHQVYNRAGQWCKRCADKKIVKKNIVGRSTFFCNACQTK